jgi:alpha-L-fucosidase 2
MRPLGALLCLCLTTVSLRASFVPDVEYGRASGESLKLDVRTPEGPGPFPGVIMVHGGGWMNGDKAMNVRPLFDPLTKAGFAWFSINYRLAPKYRYPACLNDLETAIKWVKAHAAEYNVDPTRLSLLGESAGGQLVDMAAVRATEATKVAAVVSFYAPCDLVADMETHGSITTSVGALLNLTKFDVEARKTLRTASALPEVRAGMPPFLLIHGTADNIVPYNQSLHWQSRLRELGVPCDLVTIPNGKHAMGNWEKISPGYKDQVVAWLTAHFIRGDILASAKAPKIAPTSVVAAVPSALPKTATVAHLAQ